jgi:hypothetical protein
LLIAPRHDRTRVFEVAAHKCPGGS